MDRKETKEFLLSLNPSEQALFLAHLTHELTVSARYYYGADNESRTVAAMKQFNEIQHRVSAQLRYILTGATKERFPEQALIDVLFSWAESDEREPVTGHLSYALDRCRRYITRSQEARRPDD